MSIDEAEVRELLKIPAIFDVAADLVAAIGEWYDETSSALRNQTEAEALARTFHETYERLAPDFGYATRRESAVSWADVPEQNKRLMIAVCSEILAGLAGGEAA